MIIIALGIIIALLVILCVIALLVLTYVADISTSFNEMMEDGEDDPDDPEEAHSCSHDGHCHNPPKLTLLSTPKGANEDPRDPPADRAAA